MYRCASSTRDAYPGDFAVTIAGISAMKVEYRPELGYWISATTCWGRSQGVSLNSAIIYILAHLPQLTTAQTSGVR